MADVKLIREPEAALAALEPTRITVLAELRTPRSAAELARRLGLPRQRVNYHLRELERHGLVRLIEERKKGNCTERLVQAVARTYVLSPELMGALSLDPDRVEDRTSSAYLIAVAARVIRELAELRGRAERAAEPRATFALQTDIRFASPDDAAAFAEDLAAALAQLAREYRAPDGVESGRLHRYFLGGYQAMIGREAPAVEPRAGGPTHPGPGGTHPGHAP